MKRFVILLAAFSAMLCVVLMVACEKHEDPFSAKNVSPVISEFRFRRDSTVPNIPEDSLKYRAGRAYLLHLEYRDPEFENSGRSVRATFKFLSGSGKIRHPAFRAPSADSLTFGDVPPSFNDDLLFTPDSAGIVDIELTLSDGVKASTARFEKAAKFFPNLAPIATFSATFATLTKPYQIRCDPANSRDRDGQIVESVWTFGDNSSPQTVSGTTPVTHEYQLAGQYSVRLRVVDDEGKSSTFERLVTTENQQPIAALSVSCRSANCQVGPSPADISGSAPLEISYDAGGSIDQDGSISSFLIDFGDGDTAESDSGSHAYTTDGRRRILLTVRDNLGKIDTSGRTIQIDTPPVAKLKVTPTQGSFPLTCTIDADSSYDPFGGALTYQIFIEDQLLYRQSTVMHVFDTPRGSAYRIRLVVQNSRNSLTSEAFESVVVTNTPPVANFTVTPPDPRRTQQIRFDARTSFDPNPTDAITNYRWLLGDGTIKSGADSVIVHYSYAVPDTYKVKLIVTDRFGPIPGEKEIALVVQ